MPIRSYSRAAVAASIGLAASVAIYREATARPDPVAELAGRWAGHGIVQPAAGPSENFRCIVTYIPDRERSSRLRQNLRCKSDNYQLDAATHLLIDGERVTGQWQDNIYSLNGTVSGRLTDGGFEVMLHGCFFEARMVVAGSRCEQSVRVTPARADYIREVSASLRKC